MIGGQLIGHNDPDYQERVVKFNELISNCAIYSTALDITDAANALAAEGHLVDPDDLATISPLITRTIRRFGDCIVDTTPPQNIVATRLDLTLRALFPAAPV
ncbi:Tn3 family transposase [Nonomuraea sp. NPDC050404]|uniref:Tn3 family transposase n=1 Tax=Nonomuraea sp. NPDC050404 TaxID=3155783 RepID=UPI0033F2B5B4